MNDESFRKCRSGAADSLWLTKGWLSIQSRTESAPLPRPHLCPSSAHTFLNVSSIISQTRCPDVSQKEKELNKNVAKKKSYFSLKGFDHRSDMQKLIPQTQLLMCRIHVWKREKAEIRQPAGIPSGFYFNLFFSFVEEAGVALRSHQSSGCVGRMYGGCLRDTQTRPFGC